MSNLGFETEDPGVPGAPDNWTLTGTWTPTNALFALGIGTTPQETFEDWITYQFALPVPAAVFDEDFEGWIFPGLISVFPPPSGQFIDNFESWVAFVSSLPGGGTTFSENYEGWVTFVAAFPGSVVATFTEDFESVALPLQVVADAVTDRLTTAGAHNLNVNDRVKFSSTRQLPAPIATGFLYRVVSVPSATEITISATLGGPTLDITDVGLGVHQLEYDPVNFWGSVNDSF